MQNFHGQIDLTKSLNIYESIVSEKTSSAYTMANFNIEGRYLPDWHYVASFKPGEEFNEENVGVKLFFQIDSWNYVPQEEESDIIDYQVNSLELDLSTKTLKYDFNLSNWLQCNQHCYTPKVVAVLVLNVSYPVPEENNNLY